MKLTRGILFGIGLLTTGASSASAAGPYAFVTGRRDPAIEIVDLSKVAANTGTSKAIVGRARVSPDVPAVDPATTTAKLIGATTLPAQALPNNVIIRRGTAYVVDHAGISRPLDVESGMQHGYPGALTLLSVKKALDPANKDTTRSVEAIYSSGGWGPAGVVVTPDDRYAIVANSEGPNSEDGAREIGIIDLKRHALVRVLLQAMGTGGHVANTPGHACADIQKNPALVPHTSPDVNWGCFPDANGLAYTPLHGGFIFSANEGTNDVSVIDLKKAETGARGWEIFRVPVERGPWAIAASPDGKLMAVTDRDSDETDQPGEFVSIIDVDKAIAKKPDAEIRRVLVGTDDASRGSHPFSLAWTPDGARIVVTNDLAGSVSVIDVAKALRGDPKPEIARIPVPAQPDYPGSRPRPRAVQITADSRFAAIAGGPPNAKSGGSLWLIDLGTFKVLGTVTGVGNEPYMLDITGGS
ncbi:MAG: hypothetical protein M3R53_07790 [Candidatus Eremiobacteraeota bacterium]|nr:hypothetical protein [Candidatus Eremiobacteraeota bacterium]